MRATVIQCVIQIGFGRSVAWRLLRELSRFGVSEILLLTGADDLDTTVIKLPRTVQITVAQTPAGSGSGGALFHVRDRLRDRFLLCGGDAPLDWNLSTLLADAMADAPEVVGRTVVRGSSRDAGIRLFRRGLVEHLRPVCCLESDVLPAVAMAETLVAGSLPGDPANRRALFLDRDGVLNIDHGYVGSRDRFEWTEGALDAIRMATEAGWQVFIVTNQSGVARGRFTEDAVRQLMDWVADQARAAGGTIDDVRYCPFHPEAKLEAYRQAHPWRKPLPGMLVDLIQVWELDPNRAVMVGDQETDMQAAAAAGVAGHLFRGGNLLKFLQPILEGH